MKNTVKTIFGLAALALVAAGCNVTDPRPTYVPEGDGVTFVQQVVSAGALDPSTTTYYVDLARVNADGELTVNLSSSVYNNNDTEKAENLAESFFNIPSSVTFAEGEYLAKISIDVSKMEIGEKFSGTLAIAEGEECFNPNTATTSVSITLAKDYKWVEIGEGQWFDQFLLMSSTSANIQKVKVAKAEGFEIYRFYEPYPKDVVASAWPDPSNDMTPDSVIEYIEFSVDENGLVSWGNEVDNTLGIPLNILRTGYTNVGEDLCYFPGEALGLTEVGDNCLLENGTLVQFRWVPMVLPSTGYWGIATLGYLALPSFEGDLGAYLGV